jgi:UDP-GlcNAc:undecaprenyl-phosphate GlcNAc-1-phosphate transferase
MVIAERDFAATLVAFVIAIALTPTIRNLALRWGWFDEPNIRSSHSVPVPRLGGIAFVLATVTGVAVGAERFEWWMTGVGLGAVVVAVTGMLDDITRLNPMQKFLPQLGAAAIAVFLLEPRILVDMPVGVVTLSPALSMGVAMLWIVSVVNAFNFLDGLDGLAAGVALVVAVVLASFLPGSAPLLLPFAAALGGFLWWNTAPASIFMGDGGSQFIGYLLATAVLMPGPTDTGAVPVLFVFVPVLGDAAVTIGRRLLRGTSPFSADRTHLFHGFVRALDSHRAVAALYAAVTGLCGLAGLAYMHADATVKTILLALAALAMLASMAMLGNLGTSVRPRVGLSPRQGRAHGTRRRAARSQ